MIPDWLFFITVVSLFAPGRRQGLPAVSHGARAAELLRAPGRVLPWKTRFA